MDMLHPKTLLEYPEDEPELVFASLPAGPKTRRRRGVGIRKLTIISITEAGFDASTTFTPASGKRKSNLNSLILPLSAVVGPKSGHDIRFQPPPTGPRRVRTPIMPRRKSTRYETAHRALLNRAGNLPPEASPEDIKIRVLKHATTFLDAHIQEAQERTEQLRQYLSDRNTQLKEHQFYQREKWRADRRLAALRVLMESTRVTGGAVPKNSEDQMTSPVGEEAKLSSFFQRGSRKAPLRFNCAVTGKALERRVLKQVSPLLLTPSIPSTWTQPLFVPDNLPPLYARRDRSERMISMDSTREGPRAPSATSHSATEGTSTSSLSPKTLPDDNFGTTHDGVALILSPILRSHEEIIAEMGDIALPAYAFNLLDDLDYIHDKIPLRPGSTSLDLSSSPLLITPSDWEYHRRDSSIVSPRRTATVRIPDRLLADALLSSPETENIPRKRGHMHQVSLDPALFKGDSRSDKLGEVTPARRSVHLFGEEERKKPKGLLKKKSSVVFSMVSRSSDKRRDTAPSTPRKNIASMVKRRISTINRFR